MPSNLSDYLLLPSVGRAGLWVQLVNNATAGTVISTGASGADGRIQFPANPASGIYTVWVSSVLLPANDPGWIVTTDTAYIIPMALGDVLYPPDEAGTVQTALGLITSAGVPSNANGSNGWYCINRATGKLYLKTAGVWNAVSAAVDTVAADISLIQPAAAAAGVNPLAAAADHGHAATADSLHSVAHADTPAASTTVAAGSNGVDFSSFAGAGTLNVASAAAFQTVGTVQVVTSKGTFPMSYTGTTGTTFTGCTALGAPPAASNLATGNAVSTGATHLGPSKVNVGRVAGAVPAAFVGPDAQRRQLGFRTDQPASIFATVTDDSANDTANILLESSAWAAADFGWLDMSFDPSVPTGGQAPNTNGTIQAVRLKARVARSITNIILIVQTAGATFTGVASTTTTGVQALPTGTINVASTTGFAASGTVYITTSAGVQVVAYTGGGGGGTTLTGCTGGTGNTSNGGAVTQGQSIAALCDASKNVIAVTQDQSAVWNTTGPKAMPLVGGPYAIPRGDYFVAWFSNATTLPKFTSGTASGQNANAGLAAASSRYATADTARTTNFPATLGALSQTAASAFFAATS